MVTKYEVVFALVYCKTSNRHPSFY